MSSGGGFAVWVPVCFTVWFQSGLPFGFPVGLPVGLPVADFRYGDKADGLLLG